MKLIFNAQIITMDGSNPRADSMVIDKQGIIKAIGNYTSLKDNFPSAKPLNFQSQTILPGFNDAHIHVWKIGHLRTTLLDLRGTTYIKEFQQKLKHFANTNKESLWILARGINEATLKEKRLPTKTDIDEVISDRPVWIIRTCAHIGIANSLALEQAQINAQTPIPFGGEIKKHPDGALNGIFTERAMGLITDHIPQPTKESYAKMVIEAQDYLISLGITSATDPAADATLLETYKDLDKHGLLKMRFNVFALRVPDGGDQILSLPELYQSKHLQITTVKFFADGGLSSTTAALNIPYKNMYDYKGVLRLSYDLFIKAASDAVSNGFRVATHAIGHEAIDLCVEVYQALSRINKQLTHRIEHLGFLEQKHIPTFQTLGISVAMQPIFLYELASNFKNTLPKQLLEEVYPVRSALDAGITLALSTDGPVVKEINPFWNIATAISRQSSTKDCLGPNQRISLEEALQAYTVGGAQMDHQENSKGSLSIGKVADFIVLDQNPYTSPDLKTIKVMETWIDGKQVF